MITTRAERLSRPWCGSMQFPGRPEFLMGTVSADGYEEVRARLFALASAVFPITPDVLAVIPGAVVFQEREDDQ